MRYERGFEPGDKVATFDVVKMGYTDQEFVVKISTKNAVLLCPGSEEGYVGFYYIVKIPKDEFPYKKRDYCEANTGDDQKDGESEIKEVKVYR